MSQIDEALRRELFGPAGKALRMACIAFAAALFFALLLLTPLLPGDAAAGTSARALFCLLLTLPYILLLHTAATLRQSKSAAGMLLLSLAAACSLLLRLVFIARPSADFDNYLGPWMERMAGSGFAEVMKSEFSEYNVLYQYLLFLASRLPLPALFSVKLISLWGDCLLTAGVVRLARGERRGIAAYACGLFLPTLVLNGSMFAQCDSLYAAAAIWGLAFAIEGKPGRAASCFALSLAFKLQAVFLFPILPVLYADRKLRIQEIPVFAAMLVVAALPALLAGKTPAAILGYYAGQTGLYTGLTYEAPTMFGLMNTVGLDVYAYGRFGILLSAGICLVIASLGISQAGKLNAEDIVRLSALAVLCAVFFLPRMHERYFYLGEALLVALYARDGRRAMALAAAELACFSRLWDLGISLRAASLLMVFSIIATAMSIKRFGRTGEGEKK